MCYVRVTVCYMPLPSHHLPYNVYTLPLCMLYVVAGELPNIPPMEREINVEEFLNILVPEPDVEVERPLPEPDVEVERPLPEPEVEVERPLPEPEVERRPVPEVEVEVEVEVERPLLEPDVEVGRPLLEPDVEVEVERPLLEPEVEVEGERPLSEPEPEVERVEVDDSISRMVEQCTMSTKILTRALDDLDAVVSRFNKKPKF